MLFEWIPSLLDCVPLDLAIWVQVGFHRGWYHLKIISRIKTKGIKFVAKMVWHKYQQIPLPFYNQNARKQCYQVLKENISKKHQTLPPRGRGKETQRISSKIGEQFSFTTGNIACAESCGSWFNLCWLNCSLDTIVSWERSSHPRYWD